MDWFKVMDSMYDDSLATRRGRVGMLTDFAVGPPPNWDGSNDRETGGRTTLLTISGRTIAALLAAWLFSYGTGLVSWLGEYDYSYGGRVRGETRLGLSNMVLIKGQRAYMTYKVDSADGPDGTIYFDIRPWPFIKSSPSMIRRSGTQSGVLEITVPATGFYQFYHGIGPKAYKEPLRYQTQWGADWKDVPETTTSPFAP